MGLVPWINPSSRSSTADSPKPETRRIRVKIKPPVYGFSLGIASCSHIRYISLGTPGMATMICLSFSTHQPGAVPRGLGRASAEGINVACLTLRSGILALRAANMPRSSASSFGSTCIVSPSKALIDSRARSSSVGPRPPVMIIRSDRSQARFSVSTMRPRLSPT